MVEKERDDDDGTTITTTTTAHHLLLLHTCAEFLKLFSRPSPPSFLGILLFCTPLLLQHHDQHHLASFLPSLVVVGLLFDAPSFV